MLKGTRASGAIDVGRLANAISRPGIDPRTWCSLAVVQAIHFDAEEGIFLDILLLPSQQEETARYGSVYAGANFGFYTPIEVDDEVLVEAPSGNPDEGLVVTKRLWSPSDPPPGEIADSMSDLLLLLKEGSTLRLATGGAGNIVLDARGSGQVLIGNEDATLQCARVTDTVQVTIPANTVHITNPTGSPPTVPNPTPITLTGTIITGSAKVKVK